MLVRVMVMLEFVPDAITVGPEDRQIEQAVELVNSVMESAGSLVGYLGARLTVLPAVDSVDAGA